MNKNKGVLITGLWNNERNGQDFLIGRVSGNLNAIVIKNKNRRDHKDPTHILYFFNGNKNEILDFVGEHYEEQ